VLLTEIIQVSASNMADMASVCRVSSLSKSTTLWVIRFSRDGSSCKSTL